MSDAPAPPAAASDTIGWGIIGTGTIAADFAAQLGRVPGARLRGVASRSAERAAAFAQRHGFEEAYQGAEALCADPSVDAVYVATPTALHLDHGRQVLEAGKALLCEKPFTRSAEEAAALVATAREAGLFCMEAMWMRFNPLVQEARQAIADGRIGEVRAFHAALGYKKGPERWGAAADGRGAPLAFGCYGVSLAHFLLGPCTSASAHHVPNGHGGAHTAAFSLEYPEAVASVFCSEAATLANEAVVTGADGALRIGSPFIDATELEVVDLGALTARSPIERVVGLGRRLAGAVRAAWPGEPANVRRYRGSGFRGEAEEVMRCLRAGFLESPLMPLDETLAVHRTLEA